MECLFVSLSVIKSRPPIFPVLDSLQSLSARAAAAAAAGPAVYYAKRMDMWERKERKERGVGRGGGWKERRVWGRGMEESDY